MANTFKLKRSSVSGKVPTTGDLQLGELALNTFDGKLYTLKNNGTASVVELSGGAIADGDKGDITVSGSGTTWTLDPSGVTAGTYGSSTQIPSLTVDAKGRITAASNNAITVGDGTLTVNTSGTGLSGSGTFSANQSTNGTITISSNATSANTASTIVARDASGNFSAGTITAALSGNATTATSAGNITGGNLTGDYQVTSGIGVRFGHASQTDGNDGFIAAGRFASGLNIVGTQTTAGTGRQVRIWGSLIDAGGTAYVQNTGTWGISITGSSASCTGNAATATTWQTARTVTIGDTGKSVNGSTNVTWTTDEIGAAHAGAGGAIVENKASITASYTLPAGYNGVSAGPVTIASGAVITVPSGATWVIV